MLVVLEALTTLWPGPCEDAIIPCSHVLTQCSRATTSDSRATWQIERCLCCGSQPTSSPHRAVDTSPPKDLTKQSIRHILFVVRLLVSVRVHNHASSAPSLAPPLMEYGGFGEFHDVDRPLNGAEINGGID